MSTIEKAMAKKEGWVTHEMILTQCRSMSQNSELDAFFSYSGHIDSIDVFVNHKAQYNTDGNKQNRIYQKTYYSDEATTGITLAEIYQDLIKIEEGEMK